MSEINSIQNNVNEWLLDEGLTVSKKDDPNADFHFLLTNAFSLGFGLDVIKIKNKPIIAIGMGSQFPPEIKTGLLNLNDKERRSFLFGVQKELLKFEVEHAFKPNKVDPNLIEISAIVYIDDMTRTSFMSALKRVKYAALYFIWSITLKFAPEKNSSESPSAYG